MQQTKRNEPMESPLMMQVISVLEREKMLVFTRAIPMRIPKNKQHTNGIVYLMASRRHRINLRKLRLKT